MGKLRERERELAAVEVLMERRGGTLLLEGRAGIGKTSLVEVACSRRRWQCCWRAGQPPGGMTGQGKHISFNLIFDRLAMLEQLGLIPAPAPTS